MQHRVSYAQNREDFLIAAFFPDVSEGHYVDVGAADPIQYSVTKHFYDQGWTGINIEPIPELADRLRAARPNDVTLQLALGPAKDTAHFRQYAGSGLSTVSPEVKARHAEIGTDGTADFTDYDVPVQTLGQVLRDHPLPHIHFLKVDVEGLEYDVLAGNDFERFRPELICIETDHVVRDCAPLLADAHYRQVFHDGLNAYYLADESRARLQNFWYPRAVLDAPVIVAPEVAAELDGVSRLQAELAEARNALEAESELRAAHAERAAQLSAQLSSLESHFLGIVGSHSWRVTEPLRKLGRWARRLVPMSLGRRIKNVLRRQQRAHGAATNEPLSHEGEIVQESLRALGSRRGRP